MKEEVIVTFPMTAVHWITSLPGMELAWSFDDPHPNEWGRIYVKDYEKKEAVIRFFAVNVEKPEAVNEPIQHC